MASIADVARAAGVSPSTVSYVLSGRRPITAETRERVLLAIRQLGYRPHAGATALAAGRGRTIGLAAPHATDLSAVVIHQFVQIILDVVRGRDHDVLLLDPHEGAGGIRRAVESRLVDGVILMDVHAGDERVALLERSGTPAVIIGNPGDTTLPCVDLDFAAAASMAVRHLAGQGRTELALMSSPELIAPGKSYARHSHAGFTAAAGRAQTVRVCEPTRDGVDGWLAGVTGELDGLSGIVVQHEATLPLLVAALRRAGRPEVAVVPICPADFTEGLALPVDYVDLPVVPVATTAATAVLDLLDGREAESRLFTPSLRSNGRPAA